MATERQPEMGQTNERSYKAVSRDTKTGAPVYDLYALFPWAYNQIARDNRAEAERKAKEQMFSAN